MRQLRRVVDLLIIRQDGCDCLQPLFDAAAAAYEKRSNRIRIVLTKSFCYKDDGYGRRSGDGGEGSFGMVGM